MIEKLRFVAKHEKRREYNEINVGELMEEAAGYIEKIEMPEGDEMIDKIEWVSVEERKPCGYIMVDPETNYKKPAEYLVHVKGAEFPTFAMFLDDKFVPCHVEGMGGFANEIDYWAEVPQWNH